MNIISKSRVLKLLLDKKKVPIDVNNRGFQSVLLFCSMLGAMGLSFITSIFTSKILGPQLFGDLKFIQTLWLFLTLISSLGLFHSGGRVILLEKDTPKAKLIIGIVLTIALFIGLFIGLITILIANPIDYLFHIHVSSTIRILAPLVVGLTLRDALLLILQNTNQISLLAAMHIFPAFLYLLSILIFSQMTTLDTNKVLFLQQISLILVVGFVIVKLKPRFGSFHYYLFKIREENKKFGFPIYTGSLANVATSYLNRLAISFWIDNTAIGFYSLATAFTEPLKLIPNATATASYRSFSRQSKISRKILILTIIFSVLSLIIAWIFFGKPLAFVYSKDFLAVGPMSRIIAFGAIAWGFGDLFNRYLGAHGKGEKIRNVAFIVGAVNIIGIFFFTPFLGLDGAVITAVLTGVVYLICMLFSYRKFITHEIS